MRHISLTILIFFIYQFGFSQISLDSLGWIPPIKIPMVLSGNFAELRSGHFHAGIDIKTQGKTGFKVYAVQKGYVSRIKVSAGGYGNALYINHPDGYTSVYGHLKEFNIQLEKYTRQAQYENQSFEVDLYPQPGELPVEQGDIIALTGNTGSSGGPHLHFEIRDTRNSHPLNGLFLGYDIKDDMAPKMYYLYVYPQTTGSFVNGKNNNHYYSLAKLNGHYFLRQGDTLEAFGNIGLGLKVDDYLNEAANRCGVYKLLVNLDGEPYFSMQFDGLSFSQTRYINSVMDYAENETKKRKLYRLFREPNNNLSIYTQDSNRGILDVQSGTVHKITIEAWDAYQNHSTLEFYMKGKHEDSKYIASNDNETIQIPWEHMYSFDSLGMTVLFPKESFYDTIDFSFHADTERQANHYSPIFELGDEKIPVHKYFTISMLFDSVPMEIQDKLVVARYNGKENYSAQGGLARQGRILTKVREFGKYVVTIDTLSPEIVPLGALANSSDLSNTNQVRFKVTDNLSGVNQFNGYINGAWVLFQWDPKSDLMFYDFDEHIPTEGTFEIKLEVVDERGNKATYSQICTRNII